MPASRRSTPLHDVPPVLRDLPMLAFMPAAIRKLVIESFVPVSFPFGAVIVREGEEADAFYVLVSGRARVVKEGEDGQEVPLGVLHPGDGFGEIGLLNQTARSATVRASSSVEALRLDRSIFQALVRSNRRLRDSFELHIRRERLQAFFRLYTAFRRLPNAGMEKLLKELEPVEVSSGEAVVSQGDTAGPMYIVEDGRLRAWRSDDGAQRNVAFLRAGDFFGEMSVFRGTRREATVEAVTDVRLLRLAPATMKRLLSTYPEFRAEIEDRVAQYEHVTETPVPLDFAEEVVSEEARPAVGPLGAQPTAAPEEAATEGTPPDEVPSDARFGRPARRIRRFPHVWQIDEMDCAAACLAMVTRHFGRSVSLPHIREVTPAGRDGTSLAGMQQGAEAVGLAARSIKASKSRLGDVPLPAVVHWDGNHWVVLFDVDGNRVRIADPARGARRMSREEFDRKWTGYAVLSAPTERLAEAPVGRTSLRWMWPFFRPFRRVLVAGAVLALVAAGLEMLLPVFTQVMVDRVVGERTVGLLNVLLLALGGVLLGSVVATTVQRYLLSSVAVRIDAGALDFITGKLLALPMRYFHARKTGDISRRLAGVREAREFLVQEGVRGLTAVAQLLAALVVMFVYSWTLTLVFLALAPAYAALMLFSSRRLRPMFDSLEEAFGKYHSHQIDAIRGIETVKAMGAEPTLRRRMVDQFNELAHRLKRADFTIMMFEGAVQMATFVALGLFLWVGAQQVLSGELSIGELVSFNALVLLANGPIVLLMALWDELQRSTVLLHRLNDVIEHEPEQGADHSGLRPVKTLEGRVRLKRVGFRYPGPASVHILQGIDLEVRPGTAVAIVGRSGSGKTTLVKCLAGLLEPTEGTVSYDGVDLRTLEYRDLRRRIGFVLQDNHLFDDTIAANIAFGDDEPDMEQVVWAARTANAHGFIDRLPLGYETRVGETGVLLSAGQRQRVAIARALYHRPPVLIFDEATSALDTESERAVQENMDQLLKGRTSFVIAHRLSTVRDADLILVLEGGRVVERGSHQELMDRRGLYFHLTSQQLGL